MKKASLLISVFILFTGFVPGLALRVHVDMADFSFSPDSVNIMPGDTIMWLNHDNVQHTTTSGESGVPDGIWDSGLLSFGESFERIFSDEGSFPYYCTPHPFMTGIIIVEMKPDTTDTMPDAVDEYKAPLLLGLDITPSYIRFSLPNSGHIELAVYDLTGARIDVLGQGYYVSGEYGIDLPETKPGVYFARLVTENGVVSEKFVNLF